MIETLLYELLTTTSSCESFASSADFVFLTTPPSTYTKALKMTRCESIKTAFRKRRLVFGGGRGTEKQKERRPRRVEFGTMVGGGEPETWPTVQDLA